MQKGFGMWSIRQRRVTMGKRGLFGAFLHVETLSFLELPSSLPTLPRQPFSLASIVYSVSDNLFLTSSSLLSGLGALSVPDNFFSLVHFPPLWLWGLIVFQTTFFSRPAASLRPRCHFVPSRPTAPFSRTSEPYSVPDNLFPVLLQSLFFSGSSWKLSPCPPPPVIYDALWPRCTRWRAEPSSAAPWESIYR